MTTNVWSDAIERMLTRIEDTATRVGDRFPHWADPETGDWTTTDDGDWTGGYWIGSCFNKRTDARPHDRANRCEFIVGTYYLFESLLVLAGRLEPLRV
ncbi:MAG: hypothetical protein ACREF4_02095 [Gammaproteobacteria bacterium]